MSNLKGVLTKEVNEMAKDFLGRQFGDFGENHSLSKEECRRIQTDELRLIPYIQYLLTNSEDIDQRKINDNDRKILAQWESEGHFTRTRIKGKVGSYELSVTKEFWDFMCKVLWQSYVIMKGEREC